MEGSLQKKSSTKSLSAHGLQPHATGKKSVKVKISSKEKYH
jgi:hypothetical protein